MAITEHVDWSRVRKLGRQLTTPLLIDDYLHLVNPRWTSRELRGVVVKVVPETDDAATVVIRPGWGWSFDHAPGQYIGIGIRVSGKYHWRSYSLSSTPARQGKTVAITVRAMPEGFLSEHLVKGVATGTVIRLALPAGDFVMPDPPPAKVLFLVGGSGITPVISMLRTLDRRGTMPDVVLSYSSTTEERMLFRDELKELASRHDSLHLVTRHTDDEGILELDRHLDDLCGDWREREVWACGPAPMLDACEEFWKQAGREDHLHLERFSLKVAGDGGEGGTLTFQSTGKTIECDGATTVLEAGEKAGVGMPYGCRAGICHTCTITMVSGTVRDLRTGEDHGEGNENVQTCVTVPVGDCTFDI